MSGTDDRTLSSRIAALSPERRMLLERHLRAVSAARDVAAEGDRALGGRRPAQRVPRRADASRAPLSSAQRRLWLLHQIDPSDVRYAMGAAFRLHGSLDRGALQAAFDHVIARHEVLRTVFREAHGSVVQHVLPAAPGLLASDDVSGCGADAESQAHRRIASTLEGPFDLACGPLVRGRVVRVGELEHWVALACHHIVFDGWSAPVLWGEIGAAYSALSAGRTPDLPAVAAQYGDFAAWEADALETPEAACALSYWTTRLQGVTGIALPFDGTPAPDRGTTDVSRTIDARTVHAAMEVIAREAMTPFMMVAAATLLVLGRVGGQQDVAIGVPVSGRRHRDLEHAIGLFLNTIVLRVDWTGSTDVRSFLRHVRAAAIEAFEHQSAPFDRVLDAVRHAGTRNFAAPQVLLNASLLPTFTPRFEGLGVERLPAVAGGAKAPLALYAGTTGATWSLRAASPAGAFSPATIAVLLEQIDGVISQMAGDPDLPLDSLSLVTPSIRAWLPDPSQPIRAVHPPLMLDRLDAMAAMYPADVALEGAEGTWTYAELCGAIDDTSRRYVEAGAAAGDVIAIRLRRGPQFVIAMLAVWRAEGVLVTIDPALPPLRQAAMLEEAGARWMVDDGTAPVAEWRITPCATPAAAVAARAPAPAGTPAYVFFTSGSTGTPRAVLGTHEGLAHFLGWQADTFNVRTGDRAAHLTGASFDVVLRDVLLPLTSGATLVVPPVDLPIASDRVTAWLADARITLVHAVPSLARTWCAEGTVGALPDLRCAFFAGEPLTGDLVARWREVAPGSRIVNLYGPTETTLARCAHEVMAASAGVQPVGRPLPDSQVLVVAEGGWRISGALEPGEFVIRTPFRTSGYLNAPIDQAARFVANPWRDDPADCWYRTGDRGRWRADGTLEILGRLDDEVKIGGVRVNPAATAAVLEQHPGVTHAVVGVIDRDGPRLAAWVVARGALPAGADLRAHCSRHLPAAAVPSSFTRLDRLPLTTNGKVDRRALPRPTISHEGEPPVTATERRLAGIWSEILRVSAISRDDDFFQLGGHSLTAAQALARIEEACGTRLVLRILFDRPRLRDLAAHIDDAAQSGGPRVVRADRSAYRIGAPAPSVEADS